MKMRYGFDVDKLEGFNKHAAENPNDVLLGISAKTIWEGEGGGSLGKIGPWELAGQAVEKPTRDFSIQFGAWKEVEDAIGVAGARDRIEPVEAALAAMCSCVNYAVALNAARENVDIEGLEVTANAKVDPRVLLGVVSAEEAASCLQSVDMDIKVTGENVSSETRQKVQEMAARSPVHSLISYANNVNTTVS